MLVLLGIILIVYKQTNVTLIIVWDKLKKVKEKIMLMKKIYIFKNLVLNMEFEYMIHFRKLQLKFMINYKICL